MKALRLLERIPESRWTKPWVPASLLEATPSRVVAEEGSLRVKLYSAHEAPARAQVLLFPSLINRPYILDLGKGRSLIQSLVKAGIEVLVFDWGSPGPSERDLGLESLLTHRVPRALERALAFSEFEADDSRPRTLIGHCLGGNLALLFAALQDSSKSSARIDALMSLTTPIDTANHALLNTWFQIPEWSPDLFARSFESIPWPLMQFSFQMLRPTMTPRRWLQFAGRMSDQDYRDSWLQMEIWSNDNISFSSELFRDLLIPMYRDNVWMNLEAAKPLWSRVSELQKPVFSVSAVDDHIVPLSSARAIQAVLPKAQHIHHELRGGHIGAVLSKKTRENVWPEMVRFLLEPLTYVARKDDRTGSKPHANPSPKSAATGVGASIPVGLTSH